MILKSIQVWDGIVEMWLEVTPINMDDHPYRTEPIAQITPTGLKFTKEYYNLGLNDKVKVIQALEGRGLLDHPKTLERLADSLLQHSPRSSMTAVPCRQIRQISKAARLADAQDIPAFNAEHRLS